MSKPLTFRPDGHESWESEDWCWTIVSRPVNYPDNGGPRTYSVKDNAEQTWVDEDFPTFEAAVAECERRVKQQLAELGL